MTPAPLARWPEWRDELILTLRMKDVPGTVIGEILAETDAHLGESGESPEEAFGDARQYALDRAASGPPSSTREPLRLPGGPKWLTWGLDGFTPMELLLVVVCMVGGVYTGLAAFAIGSGDDRVGFLPSWLAAVAGVIALVAPFFLLADDRIIDPRTGGLAKIGGPTVRGLPVAIPAGLAVLSLLLGWFSTK